MDYYNTDNEALLREISELESKVGRLRHEYDTLAGGYRIDATPSMTTPTTSRNNTLIHMDRHLELKALHTENIHRLTGVTAFEVPNVPDGFGIRLEMFNRAKFEAPHYVIVRPDANSKIAGQLTLYRHTVPAYIPIKSYAKKYLEKGKLRMFVKCLRRDLTRHQEKRQLLAGPFPQVDKVESDEAGRLVKMTLEDRSTVFLVCDDMTVTRVLNDSEHSDLDSLLIGPLSGLKDRLALATLY